MPWICTIAPEDATGRLAELYGWQSAVLGRPTEFTQLGSLDPEVVNARLVLYKASEGVASSSTRTPEAAHRVPHVDPELDAALRVALCGELDDELVRILDAPTTTVLDDVDAAIARYVETLTLRPGDVTEADVDAPRVRSASTTSRSSMRTTSARTSTTRTVSRTGSGSSTTRSSRSARSTECRADEARTRRGLPAANWRCAEAPRAATGIPPPSEGRAAASWIEECRASPGGHAAGDEAVVRASRGATDGASTSARARAGSSPGCR